MREAYVKEGSRLLTVPRYGAAPNRLASRGGRLPSSDPLPSHHAGLLGIKVMGANLAVERGSGGSIFAGPPLCNVFGGFPPVVANGVIAIGVPDANLRCQLAQGCTSECEFRS